VLRDWFVPDRPGPLVGLHVLQTGHGACFADRCPHPRAVLTDIAGNYALAYEDIGVVTEPEWRGRGLSLACAGALCENIQGRGRRPSWSTAPENTANVRVAEKLGFAVQRRDCLYVVGSAVPEPAHR
jgi:RimJ/RimL family protein N-acetyltransferase